MVWDDKSKKGNLVIILIGAGVKINQDYYIEYVLENHLFQHAKNLQRLLLFPASFCAISQNQTHPEVVRRQFAGFFSPSDWPTSSSSPDSKPLDHFAWE
jgi:hypothetical protein